MKRLCDFCKKPMYNSWGGERVNNKFIEVHQKCKEDWRKANGYIKETLSKILNDMENKIIKIIDDEIKRILDYRNIAREKPNWRTSKARSKSMVALNSLNKIRDEINDVVYTKGEKI